MIKTKNCAEDDSPLWLLSISHIASKQAARWAHPTSTTTAGTAHIWTMASQIHPANKDQCKNNGYKAFGYSNQGQCVSDTNH